MINDGDDDQNEKMYSMTWTKIVMRTMTRMTIIAVGIWVEPHC